MSRTRVLIAGAAGVYYWQARMAPRIEPTVSAPSVREPLPKPTPEARVQHPVPTMEPDAAASKPLPALDASDSAIRDALTVLMGKQAFERWFYPDDLIRRLIATIDNLPRHKLALRLMREKGIA